MAETLTEQLTEEVDLEELAKSGRPVPRARRFRIRIDRDRYVVTAPEMTGTEILALAGKTPATHTLSQKLRGGGAKPVGATDVVSFVPAGPERFMTVPRDATEG